MNKKKNILRKIGLKEKEEKVFLYVLFDFIKVYF